MNSIGHLITYIKYHLQDNYTINIRMTSKDNNFEFLNCYGKLSSYKRYLLIFCFNYSVYFKDLNNTKYIIVNNQLYDTSSLVYKTYRYLFISNKFKQEYNL